MNSRMNCPQITQTTQNLFLICVLRVICGQTFAG
jgi:hypothetical protein